MVGGRRRRLSWTISLSSVVALWLGCEKETEPVASERSCDVRAANEYCHRGCRADSASEGTCRLKPPPCDASSEAVCGCDGNVYDDLCAAADAVVAVAPDASACSVPAGLYDCAGFLCDPAEHSCNISAQGSGACVALPSRCTDAPSCGACFPSPYLPEGCTCTEDGDQVVTTCG